MKKLLICLLSALVLTSACSSFRIGPKGEGYMISFTDKDFENIIAEYLRPKTRELLFG